jgi:MprA protease rhombosortase-interaction domain-containing protein
MIRIVFFGVLFAVLFALGSTTGSAEVVISESDFGDDYSNNPNAPSELGTLELGETRVEGTVITDFDPDADIFTFTVAANQRLDAIILNSLDEDGHFFGFDDGNTSDSGAGTELLVARLIGGGDIGSNLLGPVPPGQTSFGGTGVTLPAAAGDYTVWVQENLPGVYGYSLTLQTSALAVPEPASALILLAIGGAVSCRRRSRRTDGPVA